jgi:putative transposase
VGPENLDQREIIEVARRPSHGCPAVLNLLRSVLFAGVAFVKTRHQLAIEILALRHQLGVLKRSVKRPRLSRVDRGLWALLSRRWSRWSDALIIVKPATVIKWHRIGFRRY